MKIAINTNSERSYKEILRDILLKYYRTYSEREKATGLDRTSLHRIINGDMDITTRKFFFALNNLPGELQQIFWEKFLLIEDIEIPTVRQMANMLTDKQFGELLEIKGQEMQEKANSNGASDCIDYEFKAISNSESNDKNLESCLC